MSDFIKGMRYALAGIGLVLQPGMKRFLIIPITINLIIFVLLYAGLAHYITMINHSLTQHIPGWLSWLSYLVWIFTSLCFILFFVYSFVFFGNILAAPFNSLIAEKLIEKTRPQLIIQKSFLMLVKDAPHMIGRQLRVMAYYLFRAVPLFILFFIPVMQVAAPFLWLAFGAWFMALTYFDYPADNLGMSWQTLHDFAKARPALTLGFGLTSFLMASVPFFNLIAIPAGAAGSTKLWLENKVI